MTSITSTILALLCFTVACLPGSGVGQRLPLDVSLDRVFRSASYLQRFDASRRILGGGRTHSSDFTDFSKVSGRNVREKDIAAIFRGVAYGLTETSDVTTTDTTPPPPSTSSTTTAATTTTLPTVTKFNYRTPPGKVDAADAAKLPSETLKIVSASDNSEINEVSHEDVEFRNGILNYFVESSEDEEHYDTQHNGRREFYPEIISSVEPRVENKNIMTNSKKYVVSKNGDKQSIDVHVYMIGTLMGLVALACLCCLCRIHTCTQLIPRGHYVTLQLLILLAAALRCIILLHDPYGLEGKLPRALISLLNNSVPPILSTSFALMLLVLLRAAKFYILPASVQSPMLLASVSGIHIGLSVLVDISNGVLEYPKASRPLEAGIQFVTVGWDTLLIVGYLILLYQTFIRASKRRVLLPQYTCAVVSIAVLIKSILIGFLFYHIFNEGLNSFENYGNSRTWSWWLLVSCERLLEIFLCVTLLTAAATLTMKQTNVNTNEQKVFSVISNYQPTMKCNTVGNRRDNSNKNYMASNYALASTLQKKGSTFNSNFPKVFSSNAHKEYESSSEFMIQWNMQKPDVGNTELKFNKEEHCIDDNSKETTVKSDQSALFTQTLPTPRYYCAPVPVIDHETPVVGRLAPCTLRPQRNTHIYSEIGDPSYDLSSYYNKSIPSTSSEIYSSPHLPSSKYVQSHGSTDHLYELPGILHFVPNESKSNNCNSTTSDFSTQNIMAQDLYNMVLPLQSSQGPPRVNSYLRGNNSQLDTSPDSAIVLDYSSHSELEDHNLHHAPQTLKNLHEQHYSPTTRLDFMNLSTHSLNDVFKHNGGLLSKLVGNGGVNTGYQPLSVDDSATCCSKDGSQVYGSFSRAVSPPKISNHTRKASNSQPSAEDLTGPVSSPLISSCPSPVTSL